MDTSSFIQQVLVLVIVGVVLIIVTLLATPVSAVIGAIFQGLVRWVRQPVRRVRQILFEIKTYCTKKRRLLAVCDVNLENLDMEGVDTSIIVSQLGDGERIEAGMTITVYAEDAKKIKRLICSRSKNEFIQFTDPRDIIKDVVVLSELRKIAVADSSTSDNEITVPCFVDDIHPIAKFRERLNASKN